MANEKVWFITGCSQGLGREIAKEALQSGAKVVVTARHLEAINDFGKDFPDQVLLLEVDVTKPADIKTAVQEAIKKFGRIDMLVNNAGNYVVGAIEEVPEAETRKIFETNFFGVLTLIQTILPIMRQQHSGHIINIAGAAGLIATQGIGIYNASKFAVEGMTEALAQEVLPLGINVTLIEPGPLRTKFYKASTKFFDSITAYDETRGIVAKMIQQYDGNQPGDPVKVAKVIVQLSINPVPPLHLPMGKFAIERMREKYHF